MTSGILQKHAPQRRYLGLWLPFLSADRWRHDNASGGASSDTAGQDVRPLVFIDKVKGASRLAAVDPCARQQGLVPGMALADARARVPTLKAVAIDRSADAAFLGQLADAALSCTPAVACDEPDGLALDITGCAHLFAKETYRGERGLVDRLQQALGGLGVSICRIAVAPTPDMARALARFGRRSPVFADDDQQARALPVAALECGAEDARALGRAGLRTIGDVADRPSVLFTARFTAAFTTKLARVLGEEDCRIVPRRAAPAYVAEQRCPEPVASAEVIERIVGELARQACAQLLERGAGGRVFETAFFRTDGAVRRIRIDTSQPTRAPEVILRLYRDRLDVLADPLDPGFGFDLIRLHVVRTEPVNPCQTTLDARVEQQEQLSLLIDRLGTICGRNRVTKLRAIDTHIPERAQTVVAASAALTAIRWKMPTAGAPSTRPLHLFEPPQPIDATIDSKGGGGPASPQAFRWRRVQHDIAHAEGPERIADEWWRAPSGLGTRDYFRVETTEGRRFWIFRSLASSVQREPRWFLHGVFP